MKKGFIKTGKYDWKVAKIKTLNYFTMFIFTICLGWEIYSGIMGMDVGFKITDLSTWSVRHIILGTTGMALIIEQWLLFKAKHMDPAEAFDSVNSKINKNK